LTCVLWMVRGARLAEGEMDLERTRMVAVTLHDHAALVTAWRALTWLAENPVAIRGGILAAIWPNVPVRPADLRRHAVNLDRMASDYGPRPEGGSSRAAGLPRTGLHCACRPGVERDNCSLCEGSGWEIDWRVYHAQKKVTR
jgi:hypothetical protein